MCQADFGQGPGPRSECSRLKMFIQPITNHATNHRGTGGDRRETPVPGTGTVIISDRVTLSESDRQNAFTTFH